MVTEHEHDWAWLPQPVFTANRDGEIVDCANVECTRCHKRSWAFGIMPNARPITKTTTPTTERS